MTTTNTKILTIVEGVSETLERYDTTVKKQFYKLNNRKLITSIAFSMLLTGFAFAQPSQNVLNAKDAKSSYGKEFSVTPMNSSVKITKRTVTITPKTEGETYTLSGYFNGQIINRTKNTILKLNGAYLENSNGEPAIFGEAKTEISSAKETVNYIISSGRNESKTAALQCKKNLVIGGSGTTCILGNVYHAVKADEIKLKGSGTFYAQGTKKGAVINCQSLTVEKDKTFTAYLMNSKNGVKADGTINIQSGEFYLSNLETGFKTNTIKDLPKEEHGITLSGGTFHTDKVTTLHSTDKNAYKDSGAKFLNK